MRHCARHSAFQPFPPFLSFAEKDETIDFLCEERDERCEHIYKLRLKLADAWGISFPDDAEKVREVARLEDTNENPKSYCDAAKGMEYNETKSTSVITTDSGIDIESLHFRTSPHLAMPPE